MSLARTNQDAEHHVPGEVVPAARHREQIIRAALAKGPATLRDLEKRTGLTNAVLLADLRALGDREAVFTHYVYALPGQVVGFERT